MTHSVSQGHSVRMARIFRSDGRAVIMAMDDALIVGPTEGLINPAELLKMSADSGIDAILAFPGTLSLVAPGQQIGRILNLTASTAHSRHTRKYFVAPVDLAAHAGADAVAVHVNVTAVDEGEMIENLGAVVAAARQVALPVMAIMYPRREGNDGDDNYMQLRRKSPEEYAKLVAHGVRIAAELDVDFIKTRYTGSSRSFRAVTACALGKPVVVAGEGLAALDDVLVMTADSLEGGGCGVSIGRNIHQRSGDRDKMIQRLVAVVHGS